MAIVKTHTGLVVTSKGEKRFKIHETRSSWVVGRNESYDKETGLRWGAQQFRRRLLLESIKPIKTEAA
ncbi:hypothetical protein SMB93_003585 [Cronobacter sakazakii]|jgi:hypothetical protein|uniref:hypothetical protein n=1 Tax=Enterobacteriaceae TaxID=543 RepID=UPI001377E56A|nr:MULTISPECIES: hypothetical protein [Enterobacteriaceae]EFH6445931.1 hypothetical protein [Escherichia coli]ELY2473186.1 hypothetical protein [Cronobacter sakazakii]MEB2441085.1 hypothetical protein [Citrobacter braakii]NBF24552.1 hypothetical protein [Enterobacter hormaechei]HDJ9227216.1 hypothetical protein [Escherichia coli]